MKTTYVDREHRAIADLVPLEERSWLLTRINVPLASRGQGIGTKLLRHVCAEADLEGAELVLEPRPSDGLTHAQLVAWYVRHGFQRTATGMYLRQPLYFSPGRP